MIITPHIAFDNAIAVERILETTVDNILGNFIYQNSDKRDKFCRKLEFWRNRGCTRARTNTPCENGVLSSFHRSSHDTRRGDFGGLNCDARITVY